MTDIPIHDLSPRVQYEASGGERTLVYPFPVFDAAHLVVVRGQDILPMGTAYTVSGAGNPEGGEVHLTAPAAPGQVFTLFRRIPIERLTDFQTAGSLFARVLNQELDRIYMILQQLAADHALTVRVPRTAPGEGFTLPPAQPGALLAWDADGQGFASGPTVGQIRDAALVAETVAEAMNRASASARTAADSASRAEAALDAAERPPEAPETALMTATNIV